MNESIIGILATIVAGAIIYLQNYQKQKHDIRREELRRQWEREDKAELARVTAEQAEKLRRKVEEQHSQVIEKIAENTQFTEKAIQTGETAYSEANRLTQKIAVLTESISCSQRQVEQLQAQLLEATKSRPGRATDVQRTEQLTRIEQTAEAIKQAVIEGKVPQ